MKKEYRICKNEEFSKIISKRKSKASACFVVYYNQKVLSHARIGISVSKKLGNAVVRNKIKRQVREMIKTIINFDEAILDYIIIVRKDYLNQTFIDNKKDLEKIVKACRINK